MRNKLKTLLSMCGILMLATNTWAQTCDCTVTEVENNLVAPCPIIIGMVDTVSTVNQLRSAISQANNTGGNRTILIADGTYQIASTASFPYITASNIVFRSLSGNRDNVILTGGGMQDVAPLVEHGFYIVGDNITIADLTIRDVGNHAIAGTGDSMFVHNVKIQNTFEQMIKGNAANGGPDFGHVQCSLLEYPAGVGPQFYIGGLDIHEGTNWTVNDNVFKNIASPSGSLAEHAIHFWDNSANNTVERNWIINCDRGIGFGLGTSRSDSGIIRNNIIYNDGTGLFNDVGISLETSPDTKVYNNTVYIDYQNAIEYRFAGTTNADITNNLTNKPITSRNGGQATLTTNMTNAQSSWFMNFSPGDLRLTSAALPPVDQGTNLNDVVIDIDKTPRSMGGQHDIGAYEVFQAETVQDLKKTNARILLSPNPASNSFVIRSKQGSMAALTIYNITGQSMATFNNLASTAEFKVDLKHWQAGIYVCHVIHTDGQRATTQLIVTD